MAVSAAGVNTTAVTTTFVIGSRNEKVDFTPVYTPSKIIAPTSVFVDADTEFSFSAVGGASSYTLRLAELDTAPWLEGAENGIDDVTIDSTPGYDVI